MDPGTEKSFGSGRIRICCIIDSREWHYSIYVRLSVVRSIFYLPTVNEPRFNIFRKKSEGFFNKLKVHNLQYCICIFGGIMNLLYELTFRLNSPTSVNLSRSVYTAKRTTDNTK